ncbi:predicted protein [Micromonas commoda]|uniref:Uncharacterized protein n=1 Tax=Micromonas commoda (strain RCC299 / NOUM17 / CCMP2709) TaxID=296587 RepID=C1E6W7_MICCC|nr:predicted protein [Micromonas commoda]ACO63878.1 predicted protein [Micromonas commoda]|eukprot:XP_002502620.1 predicted protein [Micromonas commoda]
MGSPAVPILAAVFFLAFGATGVAIDRHRAGHLRDPFSIPTQRAGEAPHLLILAATGAYFVGVVCASVWQRDAVSDDDGDGGETGGAAAQVLGYGVAHAVGALVVAKVTVDDTSRWTTGAHLAGVATFEMFGVLYAARCTANAWNAAHAGLAGFRLVATSALFASVALAMTCTGRAQAEAAALAGEEEEAGRKTSGDVGKTSGLATPPMGSRAARSGTLAPMGSPLAPMGSPAGARTNKVVPVGRADEEASSGHLVRVARGETRWIEALARCQLVMCAAFAFVLASAAGDVR